MRFRQDRWTSKFGSAFVLAGPDKYTATVTQPEEQTVAPAISGDQAGSENLRMPQGAVLFLTSDDAAFIAGQPILVVKKKQGSAQARTALIALCLRCAS